MVPVLSKTRTSALQLLASLEAKSEHPLSQAILVAAENANLDVLEMDNFSSLTGRGLTASYAKSCKAATPLLP